MRGVTLEHFIEYWQLSFTTGAVVFEGIPGHYGVT